MKRRLLAAGIAALAIAASVMIATVSSATADPLSSAARGGPTPNSQLKPADLQVDETQFKVVETLRGIGKQVYDCVGGAYKFREPMAGLFATRGLPLPAGIHGAGPFWADFDGSKVTGISPATASSPVPPTNTTDIPWLKVTAASTAGIGGVLSNVAFIQRTDTHGGVAPKTCTGTGILSVDYTTFYVFWAPR